MSIVKGASGQMTVSSNIITSNVYTIFTGVKITDNTAFSEYLRYVNAAGFQLEMSCWGGPHRHRAEQQFNSFADDTTNIVENTWELAVGTSNASSECKLSTQNGDFTPGGGYGTFQTPSSPFLEVLNDAVVGDKIGCIAIYAATLDATDIAHLLAGNDPTSLPSTINPVALWIDTAGVVKDGSDNLTSWTDEIGGLVLSPSGTVTVDDADLVPVSYSTGGTPGLTSISLERAGVPVTDTTAAYYVFSGHGVDLDTTAAADKDTALALSSGDTGNINLTGSGLSVSDNITVVVDLGTGPGIVVRTTVEDIS